MEASDDSSAPWSRQIAGPELEKLATLQKASERVMAAGSALLTKTCRIRTTTMRWTRFERATKAA